MAVHQPQLVEHKGFYQTSIGKQRGIGRRAGNSSGPETLGMGGT